MPDDGYTPARDDGRELDAALAVIDRKSVV